MLNEIRVVRKLKFCYGHRLTGHEGECRNFHGHNGSVWIYARKKTGFDKDLDSIGRVIDFSVLKEQIGGWIDKYWDHAFIFCSRDELCTFIFSRYPDLKHFILRENPTSENMAKHLLEKVCPILLNRFDIVVDKVVFEETENCHAEIQQNKAQKEVLS